MLKKNQKAVATKAKNVLIHPVAAEAADHLADHHKKLNQNMILIERNI